MDDQNIVVCERRGVWATALRRALHFASGPCETRSWAACLRELQARPAALVALEISPDNAQAVVRRLAELTQRLAHVRVVLLADRRLRPVEWLLREAGAVHVLFSRGDLVRIQPLLKRFWAQMPASRTTFREHVWSRLPWPGHRLSGREKELNKKGGEDGQRPD